MKSINRMFVTTSKPFNSDNWEGGNYRKPSQAQKQKHITKREIETRRDLRAAGFSPDEISNFLNTL